MKSLFKPAFAAGLAMLASFGVAAPASAQVSGNIATVRIPVAVAQADALATAYNQISSTYSAQLATVGQRAQQRQELLQSLQPFDTNGDGNVDETEVAAAPEAGTIVQQINAIEVEIQQLQGPVQRARLYVVEQLAIQFAPSVQQVVSERNIQFVISPDSLVYEAEGADITDYVTAALNARVPTVTAFPPEGWQPGGEQVIALFQSVQQLLALAEMRQRQEAAQAAAQQQGEVPSR